MKGNPKFDEVAHDALEGIVIFILARHMFELMNRFHSPISEGDNEEE